MLSLADLPAALSGGDDAARLEGSFERQFFKPINGEFRRLYLRAVHKFERDSRVKGQRSGKLGHVGVEVADFLVSLSLNCRGRLFPPVDYIMRQLRRSRDAVVRALRALRTYGFLTRIRRFRPTPHQGLGPQVRWISNAYRVEIPHAALAAFGKVAALLTPIDENERKRSMLAAIANYEADQARFDRSARADAFDSSPAGRKLAAAIAAALSKSPSRQR